IRWRRISAASAACRRFSSANFRGWGRRAPTRCARFSNARPRDSRADADHCSLGARVREVKAAAHQALGVVAYIHVRGLERAGHLVAREQSELEALAVVLDAIGRAP